MKKTIVLAAVVAFSSLMIFAHIGTTASVSAKCTGDKYCKACKNCKYCKHCRNGSTCGVCEK